MAFGPGAVSTSAVPSVNLPNTSFPRGNYRSWSLTVAKDLSGYTALWTLGIPDKPELVRLLGPYAPPQIYIQKVPNIVPVSGGSVLTWETFEADTLNMPPRLYWQEGTVFRPDGQPVRVGGGIVSLEPSLLGLAAPTPSS